MKRGDFVYFTMEIGFYNKPPVGNLIDNYEGIVPENTLCIILDDHSGEYNFLGYEIIRILTSGGVTGWVSSVGMRMLE